MKEELKVVISADTSDFQKDINKAEKEIEDFGEEAERASEVVDEAFSIIKGSVGLAMTAAVGVITAASAAIVGITENTREYRNAQAKLNTAFVSAGSNAETARKVYTELNGVLGDSDVAVEAAAHLAKLTTNEKNLEKWTKICTGVYATFGDSLPIEGLTEAANETAKTGKLTGGLTDALNWAGKSEEEFQSQLDACSTEQERQNLIMETLVDTYSGAATEFEKTNAKIIEANKASEEWNNTMAEIGDAFEPVVTEFKTLGVEILKGAKEPLEDLSEFIIEDLMPNIKKAANWISENQGMILGVITGIAAALVTHKVATLAAKAAEEGLTVATIARTAAQKALNLAMSSNPIGLVATAVAALTAGLVAYAIATADAHKETGALTDAEIKLIEKADEAGEKFRELKEANDESTGAFKSQMDHATDLADELFKLVDASGQVQAADETRAQFILNELNSALGTEYTMVDGVIQQYDSLKDSIYEVIAAKTANTLLDKRNDEYIAAIENEDAALQAVIATQKDYEAQLAIAEEAERKATEARIALGKKAAEAKTEAEARALASEAQYVQGLETQAAIEKGILNEKEQAYNDASADYADYYNTINEYEEASMLIQQGNYEDAIEMLTAKEEAFFEYADGVSAATQQAVDDLYKEAVDAGLAAEQTKTNFENGVEGYTEEMVKEAEKAYEDALDEWATAYEDANDLGTDFGKGAKDGIFKSRVPLEFGKSYTETMKQWDGAKSGGTGVGEDLGEGVKKGLENKRFGLIDKARNIISSIWSAMKNEADSHSPSKKTMKLGEDLGAGLEIGINDTTPEVVKSAKDMIDKTIIPMEGALTGVSWNNVGGIFDTSSLTAQVNGSISGLEDVMSVQWVNQLVDAFGANNTPIVLQVDGKTFAQTSVNTINQLTRQTGKLALNIM